MANHDKASSAPPLTEAQKAVVTTKLHDYQQAATYSVERTEISNSLTQELKSKFEDLAEVEDSVLAAVKSEGMVEEPFKSNRRPVIKRGSPNWQEACNVETVGKGTSDEVKVQQAKLMAESNEENKKQVVLWGRVGMELWSELTKEQQEEFEGQVKSREGTMAAVQPNKINRKMQSWCKAFADQMATELGVRTLMLMAYSKDNQAYVELHDFNDAFDSAPSFKDRAEWENDLWGQWKAYSHEVLLDKRTSPGPDEEDDSGDSDDDRKFSLPMDDEGLPILPPYSPRKRLHLARIRQIIRLFLNRHYHEWVLLTKFQPDC
ncbi:hypothetical protein WOLCODRAFT_155162 [Wolfiporia cocos MD-104 SS10]|uniref:Uncharacterized protein n=1 Tax=Wolfiporia cocos (strain MD-104) TaxID=742152 RepID=A0A2H3J403_WOLCO|nr:hypothetical protein WOLCODRAFT_155162 [Wolfiporia cocos MD-104 SS10]